MFPDHWSFLLGEIALYSFIVLVGTGIFLTLYYVPSDSQVIYHGPYALLQGEQMSEAYRSVLNLSISVPAGLLFRQVHHWAADVFIASIVLHLTRIFFTGAYRKPRDLNYFIGLTMLMLAILEGFAGYSLVDDLLSGMGLAIAYAVALSIPGIGGQLASLVWGGPFPGNSTFWPRLEIVHVLIIPAALAVLITMHLAMIMRQHHSQFPGPGRRERNVVGTPMWPAYALRSVGLMLAVAGVLFLLGGLVQINPIWQWGPFHPYLSENGAQPDWYIGWLIGALRLMPNWELVIAGRTIIPNPFWGGAAFPLFVFAVMFAWPAIERRVTGDVKRHDLLDRPRDRPLRTAIGAAFLSLGGGHIRRRLDGSDLLSPGYQLHAPDPRVAGRGLGAADHRFLHHPQRVPVTPAQRGAPAAGLAGQRDPPSAGWRLRGSIRQPRPDRASGDGAAGRHRAGSRVRGVASCVHANDLGREASEN